MFARDLHPPAFLRRLVGSEPFFEYCRDRGIPFAEFGSSPQDDLLRWTDTLQTLPRDCQARIELEFAQVNDLSGRDAGSHLLDAARGGEFPPADVPGGPPLALWFLLHRPDVFHAVFLHHEFSEARAWRWARAEANLPVDDLSARAARLAEALRDFFRAEGVAGRFCAAEAYRLPEAMCFACHVADRLRLVEGFAENGTFSMERVRPALSVLFAYSPADGRVLVKSHLRAADRVGALLRCFGDSALGSPVTGIDRAFDLDRLKSPFRPLPDAPDMEGAWVKVLWLRYPPTLAGRLVKLETRSGDAPHAIEDLLRRHVGSGEDLERLRVCYAEVLVRLRVDGRGKNHVIRLWPDRCSLDATPLGGRLRLCLARWGVTHA